MSGCEQNCGKLDQCVNDCTIGAGNDHDACQTKCHECVNTRNCWTDMVAGSLGDMACATHCYKSCEIMFGRDSDFCTCAHGACISGCE